MLRVTEIHLVSTSHCYGYRQYIYIELSILLIYPTNSVEELILNLTFRPN